MSLDKMETVPLQPEDIPEDEREEIHKELGFDEPEDEDLDALDDDDLV